MSKLHVTPHVRCTNRLALIILGAMSLSTLVACSTERDEAASMTPSQYLNAALDTLETYSLYRDSVDWGELRAEINRDLESPGSMGVYGLIARALRMSGDTHGWFRWPPPPEREDRKRQASLTDLQIHSTMMGRAAYVSVPGFAAQGRAERIAFANELQDHIRNLDATEPCGWIVDLKENWGDTMWPMLAGLGPLLPEGDAGYFVYPDGRTVPWTYRGGASLLGGEEQVKVDGQPYQVRNGRQSIAVLLGEHTTSSGEAVAIALAGLPSSKSFGEPTAGMTTAIEGKELVDEAVLGISTALFADRTGAVQAGRLIPEVPVQVDRDSDEDVVALHARNWIESAPECQPDGREIGESSRRLAIDNGISAPDLHGVTIAGDRIALSDLQGRYVLLDFWGTWCAPCLAEQPVLQRIHERYADRLVILGIANERGESAEMLEQFIREHDIGWPQMLADHVQVDGAETGVLKSYNVRSYPTKYLIDTNGIFVETRQDLLVALDTYADSGSTVLEETLEREMKP